MAQSKLQDNADIARPLFWFVILITLVVVILLGAADIPLNDQIVSCLTAICFCAIVIMAIIRTRVDRSALVLLGMASGFLSLGYLLKFGLILHFPDLVWGAGRVVAIDLVTKRVLPLMYELAPALCLFIAGLCLGPKLPNFPAPEKRTPSSVKPLFAVVLGCTLLFTKIVCLVLFDIGSPIATGRGLPPLLIAALEFISQDAIIVVLNLFLFVAIYTESRKFTVQVSILIAANIVVSLLAGWKGEMVFQVLVVAYIYLQFKSKLASKQRRRVFGWVIISVVLLVLIYPLVNSYRHELKRDISIVDAISEQQELFYGEQSEEEASVVSIFRRVSGLSTYYSAMEIGRTNSLSISAIWDAQVGAILKYEMYGAEADNVMVGFGASQFAALNLIGGKLVLYCGALLFGIGIRLVSWVIGNVILRYNLTFLAYAPLLYLSWIQMMLAGGNLNLKLKELAVVVGLLFLTERLIFRPQRATSAIATAQPSY